MKTLTRDDGIKIHTTVNGFSDKVQRFHLPPHAHITVTVEETKLNKTTFL
jgi:hypothetical protein